MSRDFNHSGNVYSCILCRLLLPSREQQTAHYKSPYHYFNAKRHTAGLQPVSLESFKKRIKESLEKHETREVNTDCDVCSKKFRSENQLDQHLKSKKHKLAAQKLEMDSKECKKKTPKKAFHQHTYVSEHDDDLDDNTLLERRIKAHGNFKSFECLFCNELSDSHTNNFNHMSSVHGFFVPFPEKVRDFDELMKYLGDQLLLNFDCLYCKKMFRSVQAAQHHMISSNHCKMRNDMEYAHLYKSFKRKDIGEVISTGELSLSNNSKVLGHRSLKLYYKQIKRPNLSDESPRVEREPSKCRELVLWSGRRYMPKIASSNTASLYRFKKRFM